jgi:Domain of unknown function (DUF222)
MGSAVGIEQARERIIAALAAIDAAHDVLRATPSDLLGNTFRVDVAERLETQDRANRGLMYRFFGEIADPPDEATSTAATRSALWARLRITPNEITRRFKLAARIRPRRSLTGPPVAPELPELAAAVEAGAVGDDHIRAVCRAVDVLPARVSPTDVATAERKLVEHATQVDAGVDCTSARKDPTVCRGCPVCSTPRLVPTSRPSKPRCDPAATFPTAKIRTGAMIARPPNAATTR